MTINETVWWLVWYAGAACLPCPSIVAGTKEGPELGKEYRRDYFLKQERIKDWNSEMLLNDIIADHPFSGVAYDRTAKSPPI